METIAEQAPGEQDHFRAGLEARPRPTPEERARDRALLEHELTLVREAPFDLHDVVVPSLVGRGGESAPWRVGGHRPLEPRARLRSGRDRRRRAHRAPHPAEGVRRLRAAGRGARPGGALMHVVEHAIPDPDARVIVLVHGLLDSCVSFDGVVAELTPSSRCSPTTGAGGASRATTSRRSRWPTMRTTRSAVIGDRRATVVGHSYGGVVGLMAAHLRPDRVAALAVFEPTVTVDGLVARLRRDDGAVGGAATDVPSLERGCAAAHARGTVPPTRCRAPVTSPSSPTRRSTSPTSQSRAWSAAASTPRRGTTSRGSGSPTSSTPTSCASRTPATPRTAPTRASSPPSRGGLPRWPG